MQLVRVGDVLLLPCEVVARRADAVVLRLAVNDWPRVLVLQDAETEGG